jgi:hypothetical protein
VRSKRQQTMAKMTRERLVKERRALKLEKKQAAAAERNAKATDALRSADDVEGAANVAGADVPQSPVPPARES